LCFFTDHVKSQTLEPTNGHMLKRLLLSRVFFVSRDL
jgi:hypothetical protein